MPTRKQEKRERKRRVHGIDRGPVATSPTPDGEAKEKRKQPPVKGRQTRSGKPVPFPTWKRALRRSGMIIAIYIGLLLVVNLASGKGVPLASLGIGGVIMAFTVPLTYVVDRTVWRSARKRGVAHEAPPPGANV